MATKRVKKKKAPTVPSDYRLPPDPPTAEQRIAALEAEVATLKAQMGTVKSALDVYPKLADWCDAVQRDLGSLFENDQRIACAFVGHRHHPTALLVL